MTVSLSFNAASKEQVAEQGNWSVYLHINEDNTTVIESPVQEMGQHMKTTGAMMITKELDADWSLASCIAAKSYLKKTDKGLRYEYAHLDTGGCHPVRRNWQVLGEAGATAKYLLKKCGKTQEQP